MEDLIAALQIFAKYTKDDVIHCEHDILHVVVSPDEVSEEDKKKLKKLGFIVDSQNKEAFISYRFGSC